MSKHVDGIFSIPPLMFKHVGVAVCKYLKCGRHAITSVLVYTSLLGTLKK